MSTSEGTGDDGRPDERPVTWRVTRGGVPTAAEIAAITIALTPVPAPEVHDTDGTDETDRIPRWRRAAIIEGIGGRPPAGLQDLVSGRFGLGYVGDPAGSR